MYKLIFVLIFSTLSLAEYPYYNFKPEKLKLSNRTYYRYMKPQLKAIKSEFYYIVKKISFGADEFITLREDALKLHINFQRIGKECKADYLECFEKLTPLYEMTNKLNDDLNMIRRKFKDLPKKQYQNTDSYILIIANLDRIDHYVTQLQAYFQLKRMTSNTSYSSYTPQLDKYINIAEKIYNNSNYAFIYIIPSRLKSSFDQFLSGFISPIEDKMIANYSKDWFIARLGDLNMNWNTFHMDLEKGQTGFPRDYVRNLKIMHNRWNSILKMMFY